MCVGVSLCVELLSGGVNMTQSEVQQHIASIVSSGDIGVTSQQ